MLILISIAIPSFVLLYSMDEIVDPKITIKAIGRQWYWTYEYPLVTRENFAAGPYQMKKMIFDSYLDADASPKLLSVDRDIFVPVKTQIRVLVTASDVLHSWAVPSLGLKVDACPGRLNQIGMYISRPGIFHGQCSELCGENHGFMPIVVRATDDI